MDIPHPDYVIPSVIVVACIVVMVVVARLTRERPEGWDFPPAEPPSPRATETRVDVEALREWHESHGPTIVRWIEAHEHLLEVLGRSGLQVDRSAPLTTRRTELTPAMKDAVTSHPSPRMRAELSAMRVAAESTLYAVQRADYRTAEQQHMTYLDYRKQWLHRLRQFADDEITVSELRELADADVALPAERDDDGSTATVSAETVDEQPPQGGVEDPGADDDGSHDGDRTRRIG